MSSSNGKQTMLQNFVSKGKEQRKEFEAFIEKLNGRELWAIENRVFKQLGKRATHASTEVKRRFEDLQARLLEASGVASASQVKEINRELTRLGKKLDSLLGKRSSKADARAP